MSDVARADDWVLEACADVSPYLTATTPKKGVIRIESNGGVALEISYEHDYSASVDHTKNLIRKVFGNSR